MLFNAGFREYLARFFSFRPCIVHLKTPMYRQDEDGEPMFVPMLAGALHVFLDCVALGCGEQAILVPFTEIQAVRVMTEEEVDETFPQTQETTRVQPEGEPQTMQELNAEFERIYQEYKKGSQ